jgi:RsmE family RNA methyltransferase
MLIYIANNSLKAAQQYNFDNKTLPHLTTIRPQAKQVFGFCDLKGSSGILEIISFDRKKNCGVYQVKTLETKAQNSQTKLYQIQTDKQYLDKMCELLPLIKLNELVIVKGLNSPNQNINLERLNSILVRACEQSECLYLPKVRIIEFASMIEELRSNQPEIQQKTAALELPTKNSNNKINASDQNYQICICGPEGAFSPLEILELVKVPNLSFISFDNNTTGVLPAFVAGYSFFIKYH